MDAKADENVKDHKTILYNEYTLSSFQKWFAILGAGLVIFVVAYIFYQNIVLAGILLPLAFFYPKIRAKELMKKRKNELHFQFKDLLYAVSASLSSGKSLERAFEDANKDLEFIYPNSDAYIMKECERIITLLQMNERIEDILEDFAKRAQIEDITSFVDVLKSCRSAGGNLVEVMRTTTQVISEKIEIKNEIDTLIAAKKFEQRVMSVMPIGMVAILSLSAKDYMVPIFTTLQGRIMMTVGLIVITVMYFLSKRIMEIKI